MPLIPTHARKAAKHFDHRVDSAFDRLRGVPVVDRVFYAASELGDFSLIWFLLGGIRALRCEDSWRAMRRVGVALGAESLFVNLVVKSMFRRTRPQVTFDRPLRLRIPKTSSFPSGHATSAFSAAPLLAEDDPWAPLYYLVGAVVAVSRVHVKIHHASDVVAGAALGLVLGYGVRRLVPLPPARALRTAGS